VVRGWVSSSSRSSCGADVTRPCSWFSAAVRALTAPRRATRSARIASTGPILVFGAPSACPDSAARALRWRRAGRTLWVPKTASVLVRRRVRTRAGCRRGGRGVGCAVAPVGRCR
jgi:hypothetical protein